MRRRRSWKAVPQLTPFEKRNAIDVDELIKEGSNPLKVSINSGDGTYKFTPKDVMNYFERSHKPFNLTATLFAVDGDSNEKYARLSIV